VSLETYADRSVSLETYDVTFVAPKKQRSCGTEAHKQRHLHTVEYKTAATTSLPDDALPLVCLHGWGFGTGLYSHSLPAIASRWRGRVFAVDSLGCGLSSRPRWRLPRGDSCAVDEAESWFVDGLESWRAALGLEKMVLLGHSIGGYLAVAYAERHPERVARLVLASPVGVPHPPAELDEAQSEFPLVARVAFGLWRRGFSPFTLAKLGLARTMMGRYVNNRFGDEPWIPKPLLEAYLVANWTGGPNSAGAYAHSTLLLPGGVGELAYARKPLCDRLPLVGVPRVSFVYGERDWMDYRNAHAVKKSIAASPSGGPLIEVMHVAGAGHQIPVDNPCGFADAVLASCNRGDEAHRKLFG